MLRMHCQDQAGTVLELRSEVVTTGFRELGTYFFVSPIDNASLLIDEELIEPVLFNGERAWRWQPGFYAGQVVVELLSDAGQCMGEYRIDVSPDQGKLGADVFVSMLDDLYAFDPALILGTEAAQASIGTSGEVTSPLLEYARLRRYGDALLGSLREVSRQPLTRLRRQRALVPYHRVQRLDAASARRLLRRPDTAAFLRKDGTPAEGAVPLFDVVHSIDGLDNPANRALTAALLAVRRRCIQVAETLQEMGLREEQSETRTSLKPRLARKLEFLSGLAGKLGKLMRTDPFASVTRPEVTAAGLNAISAHPGYARAYRFSWSVLRPGVAGELREETLWMSPTWEIYERWCFTRVARTLRERYGDFDWKLHYPSSKVDNIRLVGMGANARIEASLQRCFRSGGKAQDGLHSVSLQLQPDLVITIEQDGKRAMCVLDAKYRTSRQNVLDAMRSAHIYQDALRWDGVRPDFSLLLVPRGGGAPWLEDPSFQDANRVGIHVMAPDGPPSGLEDLFMRRLAEAMA